MNTTCSNLAMKVVASLLAICLTFSTEGILLGEQIANSAELPVPTTPLSGTAQTQSTTTTVQNGTNNTTTGFLLQNQALSAATVDNSVPPGVAQLNFDGLTTDGKVADSTGNGNHGTLVNGATVVTGGKFGSALNLDGVNDYVSIQNNASLNFGTGDFSISVWFKAGIQGGYHQLVSKGETAGSLKTNHFMFRLTDMGRLEFTSEEGATGQSSSLSTSERFDNNAWHHTVVVRSGTLLLIYVDGVEKARTARHHPPPKGFLLSAP